MDNICHTLVGAAMGEAGLKQRTRFGNPVLMISANLPDVDVLAFLTDVPAVAIRRGWTHGVLAQALLPIVFTALVLLVDRWRPPRDGRPRARAGPLLLLSYAGVLSHVGLDWLNSYGVRLLMPFSNQWFHGDAVFIIDPWLWLALGTGVFLSRRRRRVAPARAALAIAAVYIALMIASARVAREIVRDEWTRLQGTAPRALMVGPIPANPLRRQILVDTGDYYRSGFFDWRSRRVEFVNAIVPHGDRHPAVAQARDHPEIRNILVWSRFPFYRVEETPSGTRVTVADMRFGDRLGTASVVVPAQ